MDLIDSHCHLDYEPMASDIQGTLARANEKGIKKFLTICTDLKKVPLLQTIAEDHEDVFFTIGVHPHETSTTLSAKDLYAYLVKEASHPKLLGFGETGLDYYYAHSPKAEQVLAFKAHIEAACDQDLPLIVHTRDAEQDTIDLLKTIGRGKARGVMHCFSGSAWLRDQALDLGFYISVSGIITFKKAQDLRDILKEVPLERLLVETDSPYLAPEPYRGKPNEPAFMIETAQRLAEVKGVPLDAIANQTTQNFLTLFSKVNHSCKSPYWAVAPQGGVPLITGEWGACNPKNPKNKRRRASISVRKKDTTLIVDTSPDLREQCLSACIQRIDAVLYTHDHADHTHGIDDLRSFLHTQKMPLPLYGDQATIDFLKSRFGYAFPHDELTPDIYRAFVAPHVIKESFHVGDIFVQPFTQGHGYTTSLGYRFEKIAYSTDVVELGEEAFQALEGVEIWIVDCIAYDPRPTHSHLAKTLEWIKRVGPRRSYLTHMSHLLDYDTLLNELPSGVEPAYDGLVIEV